MSTEIEVKKWTSQAGPIQTKRVNAVLQSISSQHNTYTEKTGVIGGEEHSFSYYSPFSGGRRDDVSAAWTALGDQFGWMVTKENCAAIQAAGLAALKVLQENTPVKDERRTPEQESQRQAECLQRQAEQEAKSTAAAAENAKATAKHRATYPWAKQDGSDHARGAANLKRLLSEAFPHTQFSVKSDSFSGGDSISVGWIDGPTSEQVKKISDRFQEGNFDGMPDSYESAHCGFHDWMGGAKYVSEERRISQEVEQAIARAVCKHVGAEYPEGWPESCNYRFALPNGHEDLQQEVNRITHGTTFRKGEKFADLAIEGGRWVATFTLGPVEELPPMSAPAGGGLASVSVTRNTAHNGVEIKFSGKPAPEVLDRLKEAGFRWSFHSKVWYKKYGAYAWAQAHTIAGLPVPEVVEADMRGDGDGFDKAYEDQCQQATGA